MAGPEPRDLYNPVPQVEPTTQAPNDTLSVRADPSSFGAQIGTAKEQLGESQMGLGKAIAGIGGDAVNIATGYQGIINETLATNAETQATTAYGAITGKYKSLEGLQAVAQLPQTTQDITAVRQQIRSTLPNSAAQRAFDLLAARREGFALSDVNSYSATQYKVADNRAATDALNSSVQQAGAPGISDGQFAEEIGNIRFQANRVIDNQGYGAGAGTGMTQNADGTTTFDTSTDAGRKASVVYNQYVNTAVGTAWENRIHSLADQNVATASQKLEDNKTSMPPETYNKLHNFLAAPLKGEYARSVAVDSLSKWDDKYSSSGATSDSTAANLGDDSDLNGSKRLTNAFLNQESDNGQTSKNIGQIQPHTWAAYAKPGEKIDNAGDNRAVTARIVDDLSSKYKGNPSRVAVAYFSGEGNVAPAGSPTPWKNDVSDSNGKSVSSYVADMNGRLGLGSGNIGATGSSGNGYQTKADFYNRNWGAISEDTRQNAASRGLDLTVQDQAVERVQQRMDQVIKTQQLSVRADSDTVLQAVAGDDKNAPITTIDQLDHSADLNVKGAWQRLNAAGDYSAQLIANNVRSKLIPANSKSPSTTYGSDFSNIFSKVLSGQIADKATLTGEIQNTPDSPLTLSGYNILSTYVDGMNPATGNPKISKGDATAQGQFFDTMRSQYTHDNPEFIKGKQDFEKQMMFMVPKLQAGLQQVPPMTYQQMFDPKSKDYIGSGGVAPPTFKEWQDFKINSIMEKASFNKTTPQADQGATNLTFNSAADLKKAVDNGVDKNWAIQYGLQHNLFTLSPQVPKPQ